MEEWKIILLTGAVSVVSSIVTALIANSHTHKNDVKKLVMENRSSLYFELYDVVEQLLYKSYRIYDAEYINELLKLKPKMKLLASKGTVGKFKDFFEFVVQKYDEYNAFRDENDPRVSPKYFHTYIDENGIEQEEWHGTEFEISSYESDAEAFRTKNLPAKEEFSNHITALYEQMREDLGSNLK